MLKTAPRYTAAQVILLAADELMAQGASEFSEWDLTVASWNRDKRRFGLRGYDQIHPDHKRVMMEIMGQKPQNPIRLGLMEKLRPNVYRLTPLGRAQAARMRLGEDKSGKAKPTALDNYDNVSRLIGHKSFLRWREDPDEPRRWTDVLEFLDAKSTDEAGQRMLEIKLMVETTISYLSKQNLDYLTKDPSRLYPPIRYGELADLNSFLQALRYRFPQLESGKKPKLPPKG
jgi:hypothetical protein